ncbi:hypothetical protein NDU88_003951 [Pleurodeles waltl]|uniref:Uncharacterized protein n=1 Tax=Pleurodeles waltl TaxID=8319 RepID=A0AAV7W3V5_PLEWA|nr:hypothetical protein NDU88_003951 [Pleurodeles waltl]
MTAGRPRVPAFFSEGTGAILIPAAAAEAVRRVFSGEGNPRCSTAVLSNGGSSSGLVLGSGGRGFRTSPLRRHHLAQ